MCMVLQFVLWEGGGEEKNKNKTFFNRTTNSLERNFLSGNFNT